MLILPKPHFLDAERACQEKGHKAFLDACDYNRRQALAYRAAKHRLLPLWLQHRKEREAWKYALITLNRYRHHWTEQRQFLKRLKKTRMALKQILDSA